ncbi:hypothetical protein [Azospirillum endophyticum]
MIGCIWMTGKRETIYAPITHDSRFERFSGREVATGHRHFRLCSGLVYGNE